MRKRDFTKLGRLRNRISVGTRFKHGDVRSRLSQNEATVDWYFKEGAPWNSSISDAARHVLLCLYTMGERTSAYDLDPAFLVFHAATARKYNRKSASGDFQRALQELDGGFLTYSSGAILYLNPSIRDFVATVIGRESELIIDLVRQQNSSESLVFNLY
jgi:hypothetical protein